MTFLIILFYFFYLKGIISLFVEKKEIIFKKKRFQYTTFLSSFFIYYSGFCISHNQDIEIKKDHKGVFYCTGITIGVMSSILLYDKLNMYKNKISRKLAYRYKLKSPLQRRKITQTIILGISGGIGIGIAIGVTYLLHYFHFQQLLSYLKSRDNRSLPFSSQSSSTGFFSPLQTFSSPPPPPPPLPPPLPPPSKKKKPANLKENSSVNAKKPLETPPSDDLRKKMLAGIVGHQRKSLTSERLQSIEQEHKERKKDNDKGRSEDFSMAIMNAMNKRRTNLQLEHEEEEEEVNWEE